MICPETNLHTNESSMASLLKKKSLVRQLPSYRAVRLPSQPLAYSLTITKCLAPPHLHVDYVPVTLLASRRHLRSAESGCVTVSGTKTTFDTKNFAVTGAKI